MSKEVANSSHSNVNKADAAAPKRSRLNPWRVARDIAFLSVFCVALYFGAKMTNMFSRAGDEKRDMEPLRQLYREAENDYENGRYEAAIEKYRKLAFELPENGRLWLDYGDALHQAERFEDAINAFETAATFDRRRGQAYFWMARGYARLGDDEQAFKYLRWAGRTTHPPIVKAGDFDDFESIVDDPRYQELRKALPPT